MSQSQYNQLWDSYLGSFKKACRTQDYQTATTLIDKAFGDAEQFKEIDRRLIWCVYSLASFYLCHGHDEKAKILYQRLLALKERVLGRAHPEFSDGLEKLALIQVNTRLFDRYRKQRLLRHCSLSSA